MEYDAIGYISYSKPILIRNEQVKSELRLKGTAHLDPFQFGTSFVSLIGVIH